MFLPCAAGVSYSASPYRLGTEHPEAARCFPTTMMRSAHSGSGGCRKKSCSPPATGWCTAKGSRERPVLETVGVSMGFSRRFSVDVLVYIDAVAYYNMPYVEKYQVRGALSAVNWALRGQGKRMVLIAPGRICTSSPELGVPSAFADISEFDAIIEVSEQRAGYVPELSYGSHIFQDLVEAGILYSAVFEGDSTRCFDPGALMTGENALRNYTDQFEALEKIVFVREGGTTLYYDMAQERLLLTETENLEA